LIEPNPQWKMDFERDEKRRSKRRFAFRVLWTAIGIAIVALAVLYYRHATDPLAAGIPPKENADGTVDYTLIGIGNSKTTPTKQELLEWVIRLPKKYIVNDTSQENGSGIWFDGDRIEYNGRHNEGLQLWLKIKDLSPAESSGSGEGTGAPKNPNNIQLDLNADEEVSSGGAAEGLQKRCQSVGTNADGLEQFTPRKQPINMPCDFSELGFVLWGDNDKQEIKARFDCQKKSILGSCTIFFSHKRKLLFGRIGLEHVNEFKDIIERLDRFLEGVTIKDKTYLEQ
jgi:hypothetical protein